MVFITPQSFIFFIVYILFIFFIMCVDRFFIFWSLMEISTLIFIGMRYALFKNNFSQLLTFFIIQTVSAFSVLVFYIMGWDFAFTFSLLLKLSIFPFHFWYLNLIPHFPNLVLFISRTFFKIPSILIIYFFFDYLNISAFIISLVLTIFIGAISIVFSNDLRFLLIASSVANNSWFSLSIMSGVTVFYIYLTFYSFFLYLVLSSISTLRSGSITKTRRSNTNVILLRLVSIAGIPPFPVFFIKMFVVVTAVSLYFVRRVYVFFIILSSVFILLGYLKYCFSVVMEVYGCSNLFLV